MIITVFVADRNLMVNDNKTKIIGKGEKFIDHPIQY